MNTGLKILIASEQYLLVKAIEAICNSFNLEFVGSVINQNELEIQSVTHRPDFVIVDFNSSDFKLEKTLAFLSITTRSKLVLITDCITDEELNQVKRLGGKGFISRSISEKCLKDCINSVADNSVYIDPRLIPSCPTKNELDKFSLENLNISERETEIIKLIAEGFINKEIADKLFLSTHTVNTHRKNIMNKLGINNTAGIVLFAVKESLVSVDEFLFSSKE